MKELSLNIMYFWRRTSLNKKEVCSNCLFVNLIRKDIVVVVELFKLFRTEHKTKGNKKLTNSLGSWTQKVTSWLFEKKVTSKEKKERTQRLETKGNINRGKSSRTEKTTKTRTERRIFFLPVRPKPNKQDVTQRAYVPRHCNHWAVKRG